MSQLTAQQPQQRLDRNGRRRFVQVFGMIAIYALCLFLAAGTLRWWNAWAYLGLFAGSLIIGGLTVARRNPAIINERGRASDKTKPFDKWFGRLTTPLVLAVLIIPGLDRRFGWSAVPIQLQIVGFVALLPTFYGLYWVLLVNAYAATTVRVETERGQHVISDGPYRFVRHPMYTALLAGYLLSPLVFGSWWAGLPVVGLIGLFVWRTAREDATLQAKLPGYAEYATRTRYRLLPGVW
jgi:protein-S-isoprenylcysteine O-methyltransferase Ste14